MACKKYTLTNGTSSIQTFSYQECSNNMWLYDVLLEPGQTKTIWFVNTTFQSYYTNSMTIVDNGTFPPTGPPSPTPSSTVTPTQTPTPTVTPTNPLDAFSITSGSTAYVACGGGLSGVIYAENSDFDTNTQFYNNSNSTVSGDMSGFYTYGGQVVELDSSGVETGGFSLCSVFPTNTPTSTVTQTPTITPTSSVTPTVTPSVTTTPTMTPTPSQTFFVAYNLGYDASTAVDACIDSATPQGYYSAYVDRPQPNIGEYLYTDSNLTTPASNGFYSDGVAWWQITGGAGLITGTDPNGC